MQASIALLLARDAEGDELRYSLSGSGDLSNSKKRWTGNPPLFG